MKALYFGYEEGCAQCRTFRPKFEEECKRVGLEYEVVDMAENPAYFDAYNIKGIPRVIIIEDNKAVAEGHAADMIPRLKDYAE